MTTPQSPVPRGHCGRCDRCGSTRAHCDSHCPDAPRTHCPGCGAPYDNTAKLAPESNTRPILVADTIRQAAALLRRIVDPNVDVTTIRATEVAESAAALDAALVQSADLPPPSTRPSVAPGDPARASAADRRLGVEPEAIETTHAPSYEAGRRDALDAFTRAASAWTESYAREAPGDLDRQAEMGRAIGEILARAKGSGR